MMSKKKTEFKWFTIPQYMEEENYLSEMHKNGWRFTKVTFPGFYHFESCEPGEVVYQLDYNQDGVSHREEYVQMFEDCGWEYIQDFAGYSYFRKSVADMNGEEEIFCDDDSRLEMMKRVFRGRILPLLAIFFCCILPQLVIQKLNYENGGPVSKIMFPCFMVLFVVYLVLFIQFGMQYYFYKKKLEK